MQMEDRRNRLIFGSILSLCAAFSLILPVEALFGVFTFYNSFLDSNQIFYCLLAALLLFAVRESVHKRNPIYILLLSGLGMTACLIATLYIGSLCGEGYYANQITNVFDSLRR